MDSGLRRWLPVLVVTLALALAGLAATGSGLTGHQIPPLAVPPTETPVPEDGGRPLPTLPEPSPGEPEEFLGGNPALLAYLGLVLALFGAILLYLAYHLVRWLLRERVHRRAVPRTRASQPDATAGADEVREALRAGLADLDAGGDARRAIIACWLRLERVAAAAGTARLVADTPGDLVIRLLSQHRVSRAALERLADLYRRARYAPAVVGDDLASAARVALAQVDRELSAPAAARVGTGEALP